MKFRMDTMEANPALLLPDCPVGSRPRPSFRALRWNCCLFRMKFRMNSMKTDPAFPLPGYPVDYGLRPPFRLLRWNCLQTTD
jgi:hypothetical protein